MLPTPSRKTHPNHKIDNFLSHINRVSMEACRGLVTRKRVMVSKKIAFVRMDTLTLSTLEMLLLQEMISKRSAPHSRQSFVPI
jgi:hypothetical protein